MKTRDVIDALIDPGRLSEILGMESQVVRMRIKPEVSIALSMKVSDNADIHFGQILWPKSVSKIRRAEKACDNRGVDLFRTEFGEDLTFISCPAQADPLVHQYLPAMSAQASIIRHNPLRRLVLFDGHRVLRVTSRPQDRLIALHKEFTDLVVPQMLDMGTRHQASAHVTAQERVGSCDLSEKIAPLRADYRAGQLLAQLHAHDMPSGLEPVATRESMSGVLAAHTRILSQVSVKLGARLDQMGKKLQLPGGEDVFLHGDASPDQFLTNYMGSLVWMTDFDRAGRGPRALDLGAYLHDASEEQGEAFLDGYRDEGGVIPRASDLRLGQIVAIVKRLAEPLRRADVGWVEHIEKELDLWEELAR